MLDDILINKTATIKKCIARIQAEYIGYEQEFSTNYTKQDSIILNIERLSQATIDIAAHIVRINNYGIPQTSREVFVMLAKNKIISEQISSSMQNMVGFRNLAVHDYQNLNLDIVEAIINKHLTDFENFAAEIAKN
jgi:uncharacterized protein YutE (UPF0331/DUF86 family)